MICLRTPWVDWDTLGVPGSILRRPTPTRVSLPSAPRGPLPAARFSAMSVLDSQVQQSSPPDVGSDKLARRLDSREEDSEVSGGDGSLRGRVLRLENVL